MKNKLNIIFYIVIGMLTLIAGLEGMYILNNNNSSESTKETIKYIGPYYLKENIVYDKPDDISLDAQIYRYNRMLLVKLNSEKTIINTKINVEYFDEDDKSIKKEETTIPILAASDDYAYNFNLPTISSEKYAGKIKISVEKEDYTEETKLYDQSLLDFKSTVKIDDETKITNFNLEANNPFDKISYCDGFVLFYQNKKLVDASYFNVNPTSDIINNKITISTTLNPIAEEDQIAALKYDDFEVIVNNLY